MKTQVHRIAFKKKNHPSEIRHVQIVGKKTIHEAREIAEDVAKTWQTIGEFDSYKFIF